jgi:hypothetical protein
LVTAFAVSLDWCTDFPPPDEVVAVTGASEEGAVSALFVLITRGVLTGLAVSVDTCAAGGGAACCVSA